VCRADEGCEIIGAKEVFWGGFKDTALPGEGNGLIHTIERYIAEIKPQFIFVNAFDDTHQDHRTVNRSVLSAARYVKNVMFYEVPTTETFTPNVFVDIGSVLEKKLDALRPMPPR